MPSTWLLVLTLCGVFGALLYNPLLQRATTLGLLRKDIIPMHGSYSQLKIIPNTPQCEDLHHHLPSNLLFTACQTDSPSSRHLWFPPLALFNTTGLGRGTIVVIDPKTFEATHLTLEKHRGPFITHGIDIFSNPADPTHVTILALNHLAHPKAAWANQTEKARSVVEVFRHEIGSSTAQFVRSISHPLIRTPNDIYATSATSFYVTNDHYYRDGPLRTVEDLGTRATAPWSDTVHISFSDSETSDPTRGVTATKALTGMHNNNGLGHGSSADPSMVMICSAAGGEVTLARRNLAPRARVPDDVKLEVLSHIQIDSTIDNPSFYEDPYAIASNNASGIVLAGLGKVMQLGPAMATPGKRVAVVVWYLKPGQEDGTWEKKLIFQDDGTSINTAATAVLVAVDPVETEGKKQAWLFVTGFLSENIVATLVDL